MRKSRGDLQEHFYAVGVQVEDCLKCGAHQHHDHRHGDLGDQTLAHEDDGKGAEAQNCGERVKGRKLPDNVPQQRKELAGPALPPKSLGICIRMIVSPTPEIKPPMTGVEIYLTIRPAFSRKKTRNHSAVSREISGTSCMAASDSAVIPKPASRLPTMTAGMASTPTTNCGEVVAGRRPEWAAESHRDRRLGKPRNLCVPMEMGWIPAAT